MNQKRGKSTQLNCFSPPVMLATLTIESGLAMYTVWRYKMNTLGRLVTLMLLTLATFQLAEYHVCTGPDIQAVAWSRLGFVAITALPILGLHLFHVMANKPKRQLVNVAYSVMAGFIAFFLLAPAVFTGHQCTGNYVIFQFSYNVTGIYSIYYYGWLLVGLVLAFRWANEHRAKGAASIKRLKSVQGLILGYLVFLVPTALANTFKPTTRHGIPSVMCGFAIILALILVLYIMPRLGESKEELSSLTKTPN